MNGHTTSNSSEHRKPLAYAHNQIYSINYCQYANYVNHSPWDVQRGNLFSCQPNDFRARDMLYRHAMIKQSYRL